MKNEKDLGEGFEYVLEVNRELKPEPEPEQVLLEPEKYMVRRPATPEEQTRLTEFVDFINDPCRGKRLDSDILRAQAADFDPAVSYLNWLAFDREDIPQHRRNQIMDMSLDRTGLIIQSEEEPLNLMGHRVDINPNFKERSWLYRFLPGFLERLNLFHRTQDRNN